VDIDFQVVDDPAGVAVDRMAEAVAAGGHLVVTGGSTPRKAYERLAERELDWSGATVWFSDDRCVPPDHEHSNYGMVKAALLDRVEGIRAERMLGELGPSEGADDYEKRLRAVFGEATPEMDLMLLGLGPDAHICSLWYGDDALAEHDRVATGVETAGMAPFVSRITLTLPVVNAAKAIVFLVTGEDKVGAVVRAFSGHPDPRAPGSLVRPTSGSLTVILDAAAAAGLEAAR
jgi:6-phosphogluconolactonase